MQAWVAKNDKFCSKIVVVELNQWIIYICPRRLEKKKNKSRLLGRDLFASLPPQLQMKKRTTNTG